jgi:signal transduction histidine kinase
LFLFRSVRNWLTLLFVVLIAAASLTSYIYVVPPLKDRLVRQKLADMVASSSLLSANIAPLIAVDTGTQKVIYRTQEIATQAIAIDAQVNARIVVVDASSLGVVADSRPGLALSFKDFPMVRRAAETGAIQSGIAKVGGADYAATAVPLARPLGSLPFGSVAVVLVSASLQDVYSAVSLVERQIILATLLALAVTVVAGYLASYLIARRLKRIETAAEAIAAGDLGVTAKVRVQDEIGQLAGSFNVMGHRLQEAFSALEHEKANVETLLNTLSEGVVGVTTEGEIAVANPAAVALFGPPLSAGSALDQCVPEEVFMAWGEARESGHDEQVVFEQGPRTLEVTTYPVGGRTVLDSIVVVRDVTEQARLERSRRDFVANASHEFKTPLFSLSGFLELLDDEGLDEEERREFVGLMKEQVERLQSLSLSLLDLSQVDAGAVRLRLGPVDLGDLAHGDEQRLAQVLRALLDNAIKFSDRGADVDVLVAADGDHASLAVADRGPGIPETELGHVFDRFYRGSLTRGSKAGTGLGLSIAKDLVLMMDGTLTAESSLGRGSRFVVRMPLEAGAER